MHVIEKWRHNHNDGVMTRQAFGVLIGVGRMEVYRYERGLRRIPPERVHTITRVTGIPPEVLRPDIFGVVHSVEHTSQLRTGTGN